jgi:hypothetical protein
MINSLLAKREGHNPLSSKFFTYPVGARFAVITLLAEHCTILDIVQSGITKTPLIPRKGVPRVLWSGHADQTDVLLGWQLWSQQVGRGKAQSGFSAAGKKRKT